MPYFIDESSHQIVYRKHSLNAEVLNGDIVEVGEYHECFVMVHTPNKKFGYDVRILEELSPEEAILKVKKLGEKNTATKGQPYYSVIPSERLHDYAADPDFTLLLGELATQTDKRETRAIVNNPPVEIGKRVQTTENIGNGIRNTKYKVSLVRDVNGEKPIDIKGL